MPDKRELATARGGNPVADNQNSLTAGPRGPRLTVPPEIVPRPRLGAVRSTCLAVNS
jgi:hypothetical protein